MSGYLRAAAVVAGRGVDGWIVCGIELVLVILNALFWVFLGYKYGLYCLKSIRRISPVVLVSSYSTSILLCEMGCRYRTGRALEFNLAVWACNVGNSPLTPNVMKVAGVWWSGW